MPLSALRCRLVILLSASTSIVACAPAPAPEGAADAAPGGLEAGAPSDAAADTLLEVDGALDTTPRCSSGRFWTDGDVGSPGMYPGRPCVGCHERSAGAPKLAVAGTVYPSAREPDDCAGTSEPADVEIVDAAGRVLVLPVRSNGSFYKLAAGEPLAMPLRARVVRGGRSRTMNNMRATGDCNGCHTQAGAEGAPGRVVLP